MSLRVIMALQMAGGSGRRQKAETVFRSFAKIQQQ